MLTIREQGSAAAGTLSRPLELPVDLSRVEPALITRRFVLGYGGAPSTAVYGFTAPRRVLLQVNRRGDDRLIVHVDLALLEATSRRRVAPLLVGAAGDGQELVIPAGRYLIVASLLLAEAVEVELAITIKPVPAPLQGVALAEGEGQALRREPLLGGRGTGLSPSTGLMRRPLAQGHTAVISPSFLKPTSLEAISGRLRASGSGVGEGIGVLAPFQWIDGRGRPMGPLITIHPAIWDRSIISNGDDELTIRLSDSQGQGLDLSGLELVLEAWDLARLWRYAVYQSTVLDAPDGLVHFLLEGITSERPGDGALATGANLLIDEADAFLETEASLLLSPEDELLHTLPEEISWDLRVRSIATGQTVYLLEGLLWPQPRYTQLAAIDAVLLMENEGWILSEDQHFTALEGA